MSKGVLYSTGPDKRFVVSYPQLREYLAEKLGLESVDKLPGDLMLTCFMSGYGDSGEVEEVMFVTESPEFSTLTSESKYDPQADGNWLDFFYQASEIVAPGFEINEGGNVSFSWKVSESQLEYTYEWNVMTQDSESGIL